MDNFIDTGKCFCVRDDGGDGGGREREVCSQAI